MAMRLNFRALIRKAEDLKFTLQRGGGGLDNNYTVDTCRILTSTGLLSMCLYVLYMYLYVYLCVCVCMLPF